MKKATVVFVDDGESLEMNIDFDGEFDSQCSAHLAAATAFKIVNDMLNKAEEQDAGQQ